MIEAEPGGFIMDDGSAAVIAGTVADAIRERLIGYTPADTPHKMLILAYTARQADALCQLLAAHSLPRSPYADMFGLLDAAIQQAESDGSSVPRIPAA